jgi:dTDP-4-amino-4,6-dideoxygalactose transaminase
MVRFLDLADLHRSVGDELADAFTAAIADSAFIGGERVEAFQRAFAEYTGAQHCVGVGNGTDAIEIGLEALGVQPGDEIIVPANTFIATSEAVTRAGGTVVFADVSPTSYNLDVADVASRITSRTTGVIAVHLYGNPADLAELRQLCDAHHLFLIEDSAQAHGATYAGRHVGTVGELATFSFYPGKNLGALGDAGAIVTNDPTLGTRCRMIADHGRSSKYDHLFEGRNSRLDSVQAALLSVKLRHLDDWVSRRRQVASLYSEGLPREGLTLPTANPRGEHAYHLYVVRSSRRDALATALAEHDIETGVHYPIALPALAAYANHKQHDEPFFARTAAKEVLSLPMGPNLIRRDVEEVIAAVRGFCDPGPNDTLG